MRTWFCRIHIHTMLVRRSYKNGCSTRGDHANPMLGAIQYCPQCYRQWLQTVYAMPITSEQMRNTSLRLSTT